MKDFKSIASLIQSAMERIRGFLAVAIPFSANTGSKPIFVGKIYLMTLALMMASLSALAFIGYNKWMFLLTSTIYKVTD